MVAVASYLRKDAKRTPARPGWLVTGAAAMAVFLPGAALLSGCDRPPDTPKIFVIVASATANEPAPVLSGPDRAMLRNAGSTSTRAAAFVVDSNTGQAREVSLTPRRADGEVDYGPDRTSKLAANVNRVQQLLNTLAARKPFDLLTMIAQAVQVTSRTGTLLVLSSGLSTAGGFDLRQVGWGADPRAAAISLNRRGLLPRLTGWNIVFSGLADTAGRQPAPPIPQRTVLTRYWLALCHVAGAASCAVDAVTRPDPPSRSTTPVPVVRFPRVTSYRSPHGGQTTNVPADAFFAFNSARLLPGADIILGPIATKARRQHLEVTIIGYASPDGGSDTYNLALSAERARAVRARLITLGVPVGLIAKAVGLGTAGQPRSACYRNGHLNEAICARLRRVQITVRSASAAAP
jgi:outer membrane protein OmpA-like peptidoglycan-associated protein